MLAGIALAAMFFAAKEPVRLLGLERLYFTTTADPDKGAFHAEDVRRLLPGKLPPAPRAPAIGTQEVTVRDFRLPLGAPTREVVLRDVHDTSNRITAQWWCLYDDGRRESCWFFAPAPVRTEGKLLADYRIESVETPSTGRLLLRTTGAMFRPQGAFWLQGKDLVFTVSGAALRLDHVLGRFYFSRGYAVGSNEGPLSVSTESERDGERLLTRSVDAVTAETARRCGFREHDGDVAPLAALALEKAALCITADPQATVTERARSEPSFAELGGTLRSAAADAAPSSVLLLGRQGRCSQAEAAGRAALAEADARQPKEPLAVAAILDDLLDVERLCLTPERRPEARAWGERAVALREQAQGPDHAALGESLARLGRLLLRGGEEAAAGRPVMERAAAILSRAWGPDDPRLVNLLPWMQIGLDFTGAEPSQLYRALKGREDALAARLRALENERMERAWRTLDRIEVSRLDPKLPDAVAPGFPIHPYGTFARILETKEVPDSKRSGVLASWQGVLRDPGTSAQCHRPGYGLRFLRGSELILETSVCFECHNVFVPFGSEHVWHALSADRDAVDDFQARLEALFARP